MSSAGNNSVRRVCVTGANGFVGQHLCQHLQTQGWQVVRAVRHAQQPAETGVGEINESTDWSQALQGCTAVVHLAARVHMLSDANPSSQGRDAYWHTNAAGTANLAQQAADAGVRRFVLISSLKVLGEQGHFGDSDPPAPQDAYGQSKREAENALAGVGAATGMEWVVLRPPLVYGPGVRANFLRLMKAVASGMPLPLGAVANRRSLVYVGNLVDAIGCVLTHPRAVSRTLLVSDGRDLSTADLVRSLGTALGRRTRLLALPPWMLHLAARLIGRELEARRLFESLSVSPDTLVKELGWHAPFSVEAGLKDTARWYIQSRR